MLVQVVDHVPVIQLETPAGSIVENFNSPRIMRVPRNRMRNVKNTANLFPLQSKCVDETQAIFICSRSKICSSLFDLREDGQLIMSAKRAFPSVPVIKFGDQFTHVRNIALNPSQFCLRSPTISAASHTVNLIFSSLIV